MTLPRVWFTVRRMMLGVVVLAAFMAAGRLAYDRYLDQLSTRLYFVGDLARPGESGGLSGQAALLKSAVTPDVWESRGCSVTPYFLNQSLIVRQTERGHRAVSAWLKARRDRRRERKP